MKSSSRLGLIWAFFLAPLVASAAPVEYSISFSPNYQLPVFGARELSGRLVIDAAASGPSFANLAVGPNGSFFSNVISYTVTLNSTQTYFYDAQFTSQIVAPPITVVFRTDSGGQISEVAGAFKLAGTLSQVILGRDGQAGTYEDIQQFDPFNSVVASSGTYSVALVSSVPEPEALMLFLGGLAVLGFRLRRWKFTPA